MLSPRLVSCGETAYMISHMTSIIDCPVSLILSKPQLDAHFLLSPWRVISHALPSLLTMPPRTLGGGRVLGSAKSLPVSSAQSNVLSPSTSSLSLSSQASASQFSSETQDLTSRISLENGDTSISAAPAATGAQLACPICSEEMVWHYPL